ncbi:MAG: M23 family metallopeptidase [Patescibacteria group bacterium]
MANRHDKITLVILLNREFFLVNGHLSPDGTGYLLTPKPISNRILQILSAGIDAFKNSGIGIKVIQKSKNGLFELVAIIFIAVVVLVMRGTAGEGQASILGSLVKDYIEESSASIGGAIRESRVMDVNSLIDQNSSVPGQGGAAILSVTPLGAATIQENSIVAYAPPAEDYILTIGSPRSGVLEYTVQAGDLMSFIASDYGVSVNSILWANGLKNADSISPGQVLKIPPVTGVVHIVKKGDTIATIAKKYAGSEERIVEFNVLPKDGKLEVGDEIIVPDGKIQPSQTSIASAKSSNSSNSKPFSYLPDLGSFFMLPTSGFNWGKIHGRNGVDIANSCGTAIYAASDGVVTTADDTGYNGGFGKYIKISHSNGTETVYAHASKLKVAAGENVSKGQAIALMGTTGRSTGCHLHFEVHGAKNPLARQ